MKKLQGKYLKKLREERGYSIREFAAMIYTSKSSLQRWESSHIPDDRQTFCQIAAALDMTEGELTAALTPPPPQDELTPDQRAELKFGLKGIAYATAGVACLALLVFFLAVIFT